MKVFILDQQADYVLAGKISAYLKINHQMDSYLDHECKCLKQATAPGQLSCDG